MTCEHWRSAVPNCGVRLGKFFSMSFLQYSLMTLLGEFKIKNSDRYCECQYLYSCHRYYTDAPSVESLQSLLLVFEKELALLDMSL